MFMNRREHLLNMKNKYLTKCLCITMAAAISFTGTASVFASEETALSETETAAREAAAQPISSEQESAPVDVVNPKRKILIAISALAMEPIPDSNAVSVSSDP